MISAQRTEDEDGWCGHSFAGSPIRTESNMGNGFIRAGGIIGGSMVDRFFYLGGGFKYFWFSPLPGEMIQFDQNFQMGWNHQLVIYHNLHNFHWTPWNSTVEKEHPLPKPAFSVLEFTFPGCLYMDVSENNGTPKSSILIGFSIIFTIHLGAHPYFWEHPYMLWWLWCVSFNNSQPENEMRSFRLSLISGDLFSDQPRIGSDHTATWHLCGFEVVPSRTGASGYVTITDPKIYLL